MKKNNYENGLLVNDEFLGGIKNAFENNNLQTKIFHTTKVFNFIPKKYIYNRYYNFLFLLLFYRINSFFLTKKIKKLHQNNNFTIFFTHTNNYINKSLLNYFKKNNVKTIHWFGVFPNKLKINNASVSNSKYFDLVFSSGNVNELFPRKHQLKNYLDVFNGFNELNYLDVKSNQKGVDLIFIGGLMKKHSNRWLILEFLYENFPKIEIYGYGSTYIPEHFKFKKIVKEGIWGDEYIRKVKSSKICLNLFLDEYDDYIGVNKRIFEVLASKTMLVTKYNPGLKKYFEIGTDLETFQNKTELKNKIDYYLINHAKRNQITENGYNKVQKYTYTAQIKTVLKSL